MQLIEDPVPDWATVEVVFVLDLFVYDFDTVLLKLMAEIDGKCFC